MFLKGSIFQMEEGKRDGRNYSNLIFFSRGLQSPPPLPPRKRGRQFKGDEITGFTPIMYVSTPVINRKNKCKQIYHLLTIC